MKQSTPANEYRQAFKVMAWFLVFACSLPVCCQLLVTVFEWTTTGQFSGINLETGGFKVTDVVFSPALDEQGRPLNPSPVIEAQTPLIYATIYHVSILDTPITYQTTQIIVRWYHETKQLSAFLRGLDSRKANRTVVWLEAPDETGFETGTYRIEIIIGNTLKKTASVEVK